MRKDPGYLERDLEVLDPGDGDRLLDPSNLDWSELGPTDVRFRQRPGPGNALGRVKFMMPNNEAIYVHDTPEKHLFFEPLPCVLARVCSRRGPARSCTVPFGSGLSRGTRGL